MWYSKHLPSSKQILWIRSVDLSLTVTTSTRSFQNSQWYHLPQPSRVWCNIRPNSHDIEKFSFFMWLNNYSTIFQIFKNFKKCKKSVASPGKTNPNSFEQLSRFWILQERGQIHAGMIFAYSTNILVV